MVLATMNEVPLPLCRLPSLMSNGPGHNERGELIAALNRGFASMRSSHSGTGLSLSPQTDTEGGISSLSRDLLIIPTVERSRD